MCKDPEIEGAWCEVAGAQGGEAAEQAFGHIQGP